MGTYVTNLDEFQSVGSYWVASYVHGSNEGTSHGTT